MDPDLRQDDVFAGQLIHKKEKPDSSFRWNDGAGIPTLRGMARPCFKLEKVHPDPVAGVDEAGCAPLAGPVVAAAVILDRNKFPRGIDDSKVLPAPAREAICARLYKVAVIGVGMASVEEIDRLNIYWARMKAMELAVAALATAPAHVLVDGNRGPRWTWPTTTIVGGDGISLSIGAASIIAKHTRDQIMIRHAEAYPHYDWQTNKGYPAPKHLKALQEHGPCPLHRRTFARVAQAELPGLSLSRHTATG